MCGNYLPARDPVRARQVTAALWLVSISVGFGLLSGTVSVTTVLAAAVLRPVRPAAAGLAR
jgi:hypothetical protein